VVEFKRQKGERFENFLRRVNKRLQQSGKLGAAREKQYYKKKQNKRKRKESALTGMKIRQEKEYLRKIGKLKDDKKW
jgi:ribosomal protein S21